MLTMNFQIYFSLFPLSQLLILPLGYKPIQFGPYNKCTRFNYALISIFRLNVYILMYFRCACTLDFSYQFSLTSTLICTNCKLKLAGKKAIQTVQAVLNFVFCIVALRSFWKFTTPHPWTEVYFGPNSCCHIFYPVLKTNLIYRIIQLNYPSDVMRG